MTKSSPPPASSAKARQRSSRRASTALTPSRSNAVALRMEHRVVARGEVGDEGAGGRKRRTRLRHQHAPAAEAARDGDAVEAAGAPACDEGRLGRIDALVDGDVHDRLDHVLCRELDHRDRRFLERLPSGPATSRRSAASAAAVSIDMSPPRKKSGSRKPRTSAASVTVGRVPPRR